MTEFNDFTKITAKYLNNYRFAKVIKMLYMKPVDWLNDKYLKLNLQKFWIDDFNCEIVLKNRDLIINYNKLNQRRIYSDEYYNLDINSIAKISKTCLITYSDNDIYLSYYGIDGLMRTFYINEDECIRCSSLFQGIDNLYKFVDYANISSWEPVENGWIIGLPIQEDFYLKISKDYNIVDLLKEIHNG